MSIPDSDPPRPGVPRPVAGSDPDATEATEAPGGPGTGPVPAAGTLRTAPLPAAGAGDEARGGAGTDARRSAIEWFLLVAAAVLIAIVVRAFVFQAFYIPSESMVPTLQVGDRVLVNKLSYRLHDPRRGDVVVFRAPPAAAAGDVKDLVKRVVGLPGDRIEGRDGHVYVNGRRIREPYLPAGVRSREFGPVEVPADGYFVLGDNRPFSKDSTYFGPITRSAIVGRVFVRIWPLGRLRVF